MGEVRRKNQWSRSGAAYTPDSGRPPVARLVQKESAVVRGSPSDPQRKPKAQRDDVTGQNPHLEEGQVRLGRRRSRISWPRQLGQFSRILDWNKRPVSTPLTKAIVQRQVQMGCRRSPRRGTDWQLMSAARRRKLQTNSEIVQCLSAVVPVSSSCH